MIKSNERKFWALALSFSIVANFVFFATPARADIESYHLYQQIWQTAYDFVQRRHVETVSDKQLLIGSIRGMLEATKDPYTRFLDATEYKEFHGAEDGRKVGIGVEVTMRGEVPLVIAPIEGGPAERAGILAGDRIVSIDGKSTQRRSFGDILKMIAGDLGSVVTLEVARSGLPKPLTVRITRGVFNLDYVKTDLLENGKVGYLRLTQFFGSTEAGTTDKFRKAVESFRDKKVGGVIVDLRNNSGGHLQMAVQLAGYFLKPGQEVVIGRGRDPADERILRAGTDAGILPANVPVLVLINRGSASASEIFAGALQDHGRARLVGERSFGKASVQQILRLPDETAALVTIQKYYTPKGRSPHKVGLQPDVKVAALKATRDENYGLLKLRESGFLDSFRKEQPAYSREVLGVFIKQAGERGVRLSENTALLFLKRFYDVRREVVDLETDIQLGKALALLRN